MPELILASSSPRRALLLSAAGYRYAVRPADVVEEREPGESPEEMVLRLSTWKSEAHPVAAGDVVLAADTVVVRDDDVLGKPIDRDDAIQTLRSLAGRHHRVLTGWTVRSTTEERFGVAESLVRFTDRTDAELAGYVDRVQPYDKAGSYALQGDDGWLVAEVVGSRGNVMGLPIGDIAEALSDLGIERSTAERG